MNRRAFHRIVAVVALLFSLPLPSTFADTPTVDCTTNLNAYTTALSLYSNSAKSSGSNFKELSRLFQQAQQERASCLKAINQNYKDQLQQIRDKYASLLISANKKTASTLKTQLSSEISAATLSRDETIKNLPELPKLPTKEKKK